MGNVDLSVMKNVTETLIKHGVGASLEYPGFINIPLEDETYLNIATANGDWGADRVNSDGHVLEWFAVAPRASGVERVIVGIMNVLCSVEGTR